MNSAKIWGIKIEIYLTAQVPMGINIDQPGVQRNRYQMTPSTAPVQASSINKSRLRLHSFLPIFLKQNMRHGAIEVRLYSDLKQKVRRGVSQT